MIVEGNLNLKIDDVVFTAVDGDPIKNGKAGFIVSNSQARFDDVEITGDNVSERRSRNVLGRTESQSRHYMGNAQASVFLICGSGDEVVVREDEERIVVDAANFESVKF